MKPSRDYLLNVLAQGGSRAIAMASGFIVFVILARVLGAEQLGQYAFVMAIVLIGGNVAEFGITASLSKDLPGLKAGGGGQAAIYFGNYLMLRALLAVLVLSIAIVLILNFAPASQEPLLIGCLAIPFIGARFCETVYQIYERPAYTIYVSAWYGVSQLLMALVLLLVFRVGLVGYLYGFLLVQVLYFTLSMFFATKLVAPRFHLDRRIWLGIAGIALPVGFWSLFNIVNAKADVFLIAHLRNDTELGVYNAAYRLLDLANAVAITAATPLVPVLTKRFSSDPETARRNSLTVIELVLICALPAPILAPHLAPAFVLFLFGEEFAQAIPLVEVFAWVLLLLVPLYFSMSINLAAGNVGYTWWKGLLGAVTNISLNLMLIPVLGILGAAYAALISNALMLLVSLYFVRFNLGVFIPVNRIFRLSLAGALPVVAFKFLDVEPAAYLAPVAFLLYLLLLYALGMLPKTKTLSMLKR